jgi:hypothetical protein
MRSEIVGCSGERPTVNEAVGGFSVFLVTRIAHSICASQVSSYAVRPVFSQTPYQHNPPKNLCLDCAPRQYTSAYA